MVKKGINLILIFNHVSTYYAYSRCKYVNVSTANTEINMSVTNRSYPPVGKDEVAAATTEFSAIVFLVVPSPMVIEGVPD